MCIRSYLYVGLLCSPLQPFSISFFRCNLMLWTDKQTAFDLWPDARTQVDKMHPKKCELDAARNN